MKLFNLLTNKKQSLNLLFAVVISFFSVNSIAAEMPKMKMTAMQGGDAPADARDPLATSGGYEYRGMGGWEDTDEMVISKIMIDQLELQNSNKENLQRWDMQAWVGTDYKKFWFKTEGDFVAGQSEGEIELQGLYSQAVSAFWDLQYGLRYDRVYNTGSSNEHFFGVLGVQGLAPYWFEVESALFVDNDGILSARVAASYDLLFTQRLILQPRMEFNLSAGDVPKLGVGKGFNDLQLGLRLRYEFTRKIAPYIGIEWTKQYANTANFTLADGGVVEDVKLISGIRLWF